MKPVWKSCLFLRVKSRTSKLCKDASKKGTRKLSVTGISIGGGNIQISELNGFKISLSMGTPTLIVVHQDVPGMIAKVTSILSETNTNIGTMTVTRESKGENAIMIIEVDDPQVEETVKDSNSCQISTA